MMSDHAPATADLYDQHEDAVAVAAPIFRDFGGHARFHGPVSTCKVFEDNTLVREALAEAGAGRVLVVDGGGSLRCALVGDKLAQLAVDSGWAGVVVWGCIRDAAAIGALPIGIKALATHPRRSVKRGAGERDVDVEFAGVRFRPSEYLYADEDGILMAPGPLTGR